MDEAFLYTLGLVKATTLSMMKSRGYETRAAKSPYEEMLDIYTTATTTKCSLAKAATQTYKGRGLPSLTVVFVDRNVDPMKRKDKMVSTEQVKGVLLDHPGPKVLVVPFKLSPQAKKEIQPYGIQVFTFDNLVIDIVNHCLYVPHEKLKEDSDEYNDAEYLPKISVSDPVVRWFNFPVGSVLRINRSDCPVYRVVA